MSQPQGARSVRTPRIVGYVAMLYGFLGVFAGVSGAATYIPYRAQKNQSLETAAILTAVSAVGAAVSMIGVVSGWWLVRGRERAWRANLLVAAGCVATVAAFAAVMPASTPSPVPGGVPATGFLAVVAAAYGAEALVVLLGRRSRRIAAEAARGA